MNKTLIALAILSTAAHADEGMWMPQQLPQVAKQLKAAGLKLDPSKLTQLTDFPMGARLTRQRARPGESFRQKRRRSCGA